MAKFILLIVLILSIGCRSQEAAQTTPVASFSSQPVEIAEPTDVPPTPSIKYSSRQDRTVPPTPTLHPEVTTVQLPTTEARHLEVVTYDGEIFPRSADPVIENKMATAVPPVACDERMPGLDLLAVVTKDYGISRDFAPNDLVPLAEHIPYNITMGYPTEVRAVILEPLVEMINDMLAEGAQPQVLSGYRSYAAQAISWNKWKSLYPEHADIISAQPGHSEHQLGTVIDFGSPELAGIVGQPGIQFHTYFYKTSEGQWLAENAHKYGFTLSFTEEAFDTTGFYYEPWHFRYVGKTMAAQLREQRLTLTEYQLANEPPPCTP